MAPKMPIFSTLESVTLPLHDFKNLEMGRLSWISTWTLKVITRVIARRMQRLDTEEEKLV